MNKQTRKLLFLRMLFISVCVLFLLLLILFSSPLIKETKLFLSLDGSIPMALIVLVLLVSFISFIN